MARELITKVGDNPDFITLWKLMDDNCDSPAISYFLTQEVRDENQP
jgi:hypothetical protein